MGFFSSKCSKTKISIPAGNTGLPPEASTVVVVTPKNKFEGLYDGYGRVITDTQEIDISDMMMNNKLKWVRKDHYKGESYEQLKPAENCEFQGYFYDQEDINIIEMSLRHNSRDFIVDD